MFKRLLESCLLPLPIVIALLGAGLLLLRFTKRQRAAQGLLSSAAALLLLTGYGIFDRALLGPLEGRYHALDAVELQAMAPAPAAVVLLGAGFRPDADLPPNARLSSTGLARLTECIRLLRLLPQARLIVSDGLGQGQSTADTAVFLGVPRDRITVEPRSNDTADEAALLRPLIDDAPFLLVTSAAHMRRAMGLFQKQGLHPIAAPTDFMGAGSVFAATDLIPSTSNIKRTDIALHEWLGLMWAGMRGQI